MNRFEEYLAMLKENNRIAVRIDWLHEDETTAFNLTEDLYDMSGSLSVTMENGIRSTATLKLSNIDHNFPVDPNNIWFDQKIRINLGLYLSDGQPFYIPKGNYRLQIA